MAWTNDQTAAAAADLLEAERTGVQCGLMSLRRPGLDLDGAYRIQDAVVAGKLAAGRTQIGWKIGLTSRAMQDALKITPPDSGDRLDRAGGTVHSAAHRSGDCLRDGRRSSGRAHAE